MTMDDDKTVARPDLRWVTPGRSSLAGIEWDRVIGHGRPIDPYLVWADLTAGLGFSTSGARDLDRWPVIIETVSAPQSLQSTEGDCVWGLLAVAGTYLRQTGAGPVTRSRFLTARLQPCALRQVLASRVITRVQLGLPRIPDSDPTPGTPASATREPVVIVGFIDDGCPFAHPDLLDANGNPRVVALWDQDGARRPDAPAAKRWEPVTSIGYGAMLGEAALSKAVRGTPQAPADDPLDPVAPYWRVDYVPTWPEPDRNANSLQTDGPPLPADLMMRSTHGAGVMQIAMGRPPAEPYTPPAEPDLKAPAADAADEWRAVFVQLPTRTVLDTSGGSLAVHVLDGLRFILDRSGDFKAPSVVVNISYGAVAGAHDGTSILECAISDLVAEAKRLWVVIAAGNAHRARTTARVRLTPAVPRSFVWTVAPDHPHESYLEIWLPESDSMGRPLGERWVDELLVSVHPPGAEPLSACFVGDVRLLQSQADAGEAGCVGGVIFARRVVQTQTAATMLLLVAAPTRRPLPGQCRPREPGPSGDWTISLLWRRAAAPEPVVEIRAWTERNDLLYGSRRGQQASVWGDDPARAVTEHMPDARDAVAGSGFPAADVALQDEAMPPEPALGTLAGTPPSRLDFDRADADADRGVGAVVVVGGYRLNDGEMSPYSSGGPNRNVSRTASAAARRRVRAGEPPEMRPAERLQPDVDAPSDLNAVVRGLRVAGMRPGSWARLSGTSAAAPVVTRLIANAVSPRGSLDPPKPEPPPAQVTAPWRRTEWPTLDDAFRKGRRRIRP